MQSLFFKTMKMRVFDISVLVIFVFLFVSCDNSDELTDLTGLNKVKSYYVGTIEVTEYELGPDWEMASLLGEYPKDKEHFTTTKWHIHSISDSAIINFIIGKLKYYEAFSDSADLRQLYKFLENINNCPDAFYVSGYYRFLINARGEKFKNYSQIYIVDQNEELLILFDFSKN